MSISAKTLGEPANAGAEDLQGAIDFIDESEFEVGHKILAL